MFAPEFRREPDRGGDIRSYPDTVFGELANLHSEKARLIVTPHSVTLSFEAMAQTSFLTAHEKIIETHARYSNEEV